VSGRTVPAVRGQSLRGRSAAAAAVTLIGLAAAAGCSSSASSSGAPTATATTTVTASAPSSSNSAAVTTPTSPSGGGTAACATSTLQVKQSAPEGYAGGVYVTLVFTNASGSASCTLYGYPGVSLLTSSRGQIGLAAKRTTTTAAKLVTLAPGGSAHASLQIVDALNFSSSTCGPTKATYLQIFPPNQRAAVFLTNTSDTCSKSVQTLFIGPVQAGASGTS